MMIIEDAIRFLREYPPFKFLDAAALHKVALNLGMEFIPKDKVVLTQDGPPSEFLWIIKQGGVRVLVKDESGSDTVVDYRGEGDTFGFLSLIGKERQQTTVIALEDTICYQLPKAKVMALLEGNPVFIEYFLRSHFSKYIHRTHSEMNAKSMQMGGSDKLLFTTPIGELARGSLVTALKDVSIREAAAIMTAQGVDFLVVVNSHQIPIGIITDTDLRGKVLAKGRNAEDPVYSIMSSALIKADARDYCFEALLIMIRYNVHHILVVESGKPLGVVTNHDIMMLQSTSPLAIAREIENQHTVEKLVPVARRIEVLVSILLKEGAKASNITRILTEVNDRLERKILEIAERKFGPPPVPYCWIVYGSEGRKEQTFKTDQDNAIIYDDPASETARAEAAAYFAGFSEFVIDALLRCGIAACPGNYMATNPLWRQPLKVWKGYFSEWINTPTPDAILFSVILFDFRPVHGDMTLAERLREHLGRELKDQAMFLKFMSNIAINVKPPLGIFRTFVVEKSGEHKDQLNLKHKCIAPIINIVRLLALECQRPETSTLDRVDALRREHGVAREYAEELEHVFEFLMLLRVHHQYKQISSGSKPDNFINPYDLSNLEKKTLKEACQLILDLQSAVFRQYNPGMSM